MGALDPIGAVTAPDPYPYYAQLVAERPFYRDDVLGMWVASSAAAVEAVLTSPSVRVRPPSETVPNAIVGTAAGDIFARLVRMNDGPYHAALKPLLSVAFDALDAATLSAVSDNCAAKLVEDAGPPAGAASISAFAFALPAVVIATLIGLPPEMIAQLPQRARALVRAFAPGAQPDDIADGAASVTMLCNAVSDAFRVAQTPLAAMFAREPGAGASGTIARADMVANAVGFFSQAYDATAGLIGAMLLALASRAELCGRARADHVLLAAVAAETARHDAPVQNTRRFVAQDGTIFGQDLREGEMILVVLAAANRDPSVNPDPDRFDPMRENRRTYTFGFGPHACPGMQLAVTIARAGVARLLDAGLDVASLRSPAAYVPSVNARIPVFAAPR